MTVKAKAHIAVLIANFFFGGSMVAVKHITPYVMQPLAVNVLRVSVAFSLFWLLYFFKPSNASIQQKHIPRFIICAICGVVINQILFIKGVSLTTPIHASLLSLSTPIAITIIAAWLLKEMLSISKIMGLLLGIAGASILVLSKTKDAVASNMVTGDIFVIINAISYAFYLVLARPLMNEYPAIHVTRWIFLLGALCIVPIGFKDVLAIQWHLFEFSHWFALCFLVLGATFFAYLFIVYGISILGASVTGTYIYTQPIFATITAMILFNEHLSLLKIFAAVCIFSGVFIANYKRK
ncbi:MAG: DMT family transporter [Chitinophagaceae bacterium]